MTRQDRQPEEQMRVSQLSLAAYLYSSGFKHQGFEMINERDAQWLFEVRDGISEAVNDFHDGCGEVEPRKYQRSLTQARKDLFAFLDNERS